MTSTTQEIWSRQFEQVRDALLPWAIDTEHGLFFDPHAAPADLLDLYRDLCRIGYANGWVE